MRDDTLPITDHLLELRRRLTWAAIAAAVCTGAAFAFHEQILTLLMAPAQGFTDKSPAIGFDAGQGGEQETGFDLAGVAGQPDDVSVYDSRFVPHFGLISSQQVN